jgi:hypothetical protein
LVGGFPDEQINIAEHSWLLYVLPVTLAGSPHTCCVTAEGTQAGGSQGAAPKAKGGRKKKAAAAADGAEGAAAEEVGKPQQHCLAKGWRVDACDGPAVWYKPEG